MRAVWSSIAGGLVLDIGFAPAEPPHAEGRVLRHRHVRKKRVVLEDGVDRAFVGGEVAEFLAVEENGPLGDVLEACDQAKQGGLAAARRPEQREKLVVSDRQTHPGERGHRAESFDGIAYLDRYALVDQRASPGQRGDRPDAGRRPNSSITISLPRPVNPRLLERDIRPGQGLERIVGLVHLGKAHSG